MRSRSIILCSLTALLSAVDALTITSPSGGTVDPTKSIVVTWTSTASDPATFDLVFGSNDPASLTQSYTVGSGISKDAGSFTIPANTLSTYGSQFVLKAQDGSGSELTTSGSFNLAQGDLIQTTDAQGQTTLISASLSNGGGATETAAPSGSPSEPSDSVTLTGTNTASTGTSSFRTSITTPTRSSESSTAAASSATASTSANAQPRLGSNSEIVLSAAGVLAGVVALLA